MPDFMKATPRPTPTAHPPQDQAADGEPGSPPRKGVPTVRRQPPLRITGPGQRAGDDDPVVAGEHPGEALAVTLRQHLPQPPLPLPASRAPILSSLVPAWPA